MSSNTYTRLVTRCCGATHLVSAWFDYCIFNCKQNSSSLLEWHDWLLKESLPYIGPSFNWCTLVNHRSSCDYIYLSSGSTSYWNDQSICKYYTGAYFLDTWTLLCLRSHHIYCMCPVLCTQDHFLLISCGFLVSLYLLTSCLNLKVFLFLLDLLGGISVHWCYRRLTWTACGSLVTSSMCFAVACKHSIFWARCLTVLAGNLFNSTWPKFKVLETNDSFKKNQKISLSKIWAVSCG